jgi:hypothetical protein
MTKKEAENLHNLKSDFEYKPSCKLAFKYLLELNKH